MQDNFDFTTGIDLLELNDMSNKIKDVK